MKRVMLVAVVAVALLTGALLVAACGPQRPSAAELKAQCFSNQAVINESMQMLYQDTGSYPPAATVAAKLDKRCPSGGVYTVDPASGIVTCSIHGRP